MGEQFGLKLYDLPKPLEEMDLKETKQALKGIRGNIEKLEKAIEKKTADIKAQELKDKVSDKPKAAPKATATKSKPAKVAAKK